MISRLKEYKLFMYQY